MCWFHIIVVRRLDRRWAGNHDVGAALFAICSRSSTPAHAHLTSSFPNGSSPMDERRQKISFDSNFIL